MTKRLSALVSASVFGSAVAGCSSTQVNTDYDPRARFSQYRTFEVEPGRVVERDAPGGDDTLVKDRIESAIENNLEAKGLQETKADPDLIVRYTAGAKTVEEIEDEWGDAWDDEFDTPWVEEYTVGTLVIDIVDADTNKTVFRTIAKAEDEDFRSEEFVRGAVEKALKKYPPEPGQKQG
jgi:hypothetical protein